MFILENEKRGWKTLIIHNYLNRSRFILQKSDVSNKRKQSQSSGVAVGLEIKTSLIYTLADI